MRKILINFAHPARSRSKMNNAMYAAVEGLDGVTINDLYAHYPDFLIDVKREQQLCEINDVVIFQHPFYWYSTPAIIKEWLDLVLEYNWAYGSKGKSLHGKLTLQAITAGGNDSTYQHDGYNRFTIKELTAPYQATANLCGMQWLPPFTVLGIHRGISKESVRAHAEDYRRAVVALRDERLDLDQVQKTHYLNNNLNLVIREA